jgi:nucleoside-diphosphate-sugar epimerase
MSNETLKEKMKKGQVKASVTGAGGFIGGHLVKHLIDIGYTVKAFDIKPIEEWHQVNVNAQNFHSEEGNLYNISTTNEIVNDVDIVYNLACLMGGIGFCHNNHLLTGLSNLINQNLIRSVLSIDKKPHIFYSSSACVYNENKQSTKEDVYLKEEDAWPAQPDLLYGLEKSFSEKLYEYLNKEFGVPITIARFHNVYGPGGVYDGGKEKAPAASIRKAIEFKNGKIDKIKIWGDGTIKRSFMYIDDAIEGIQRLVENGYNKPINLGSSEGVTIQALHYLASNCLNVTPEYEYDLTAPQGVASRNSDNTLIKLVLGWEPTYPLIQGMIKTAKWIEGEMKNG